MLLSLRQALELTASDYWMQHKLMSHSVCTGLESRVLRFVMGPALQQEGAHQPDQMALQLQVPPMLGHSCNEIDSCWLMPSLVMAGKFSCLRLASQGIIAGYAWLCPGRQRALPPFEVLSACAGYCAEGLEGSGNPWAEQHVPGRCLPSSLPPPGTHMAPCDSPRHS